MPRAATACAPAKPTGGSTRRNTPDFSDIRMPPQTALSFLVFVLSIYGLAWLITRARLTEPLRKRISPIPFLGPLVHCIVCTGTWVAMAALLLLPWAPLLGSDLRIQTPLDFLLAVGLCVTGLWSLARLLGDAD